MIVTWNLFVLVLALVLLMLAGINTPTHPRINLGWLGAFFALLALTFR